MKKTYASLTVLCILIIILSAFASVCGLLPGAGAPILFTTMHGETVQLNGSGIYHFDTVSAVSQAKAQDVVTLALGIPLLIFGMLLYRKGSLRGAFLLAGTLGYFLYTYVSYSFLIVFNALFPVYVVLFSLSLFAFIQAVLSIDVDKLPSHFSDKLPRKTIASLLMLVSAFLLLAWGGRIFPAIVQNIPPIGLESYTTLVIQALDLALIVPFSLVGAILLLKKNPFGYLISAVMLFKGLTMATAVSAMALGMVLKGVPISVVELVVFPVIDLATIIMTIILFQNIRQLK